MTRRGDTRHSYLRKCVWQSRASIAIILAIAPFGACAQQNLLPGSEDLGASAPEIRILPSAAGVSVEQELRVADGALMQAIAANDRISVARLLHPEFTWIDRDGRSRNKSELVNWIVLLSAGPDVNLSVQPYGRVALITGTHQLAPDNALALFARIWVRQPSGWRLLLYQETTRGDSSAPDLQRPDLRNKDARYGMAREPWSADCDNPCRSLPYKPLSSDAQEIVASFMAGERAVFDGNTEAASRILGDDALFVMPQGAQPMDNAQRIAGIDNFGDAKQVDHPLAVSSMALWVFGNAAVMSADQESLSGEMLRATHIWAKRGGRWQVIFSQQTLVQ